MILKLALLPVKFDYTYIVIVNFWLAISEFLGIGIQTRFSLTMCDNKKIYLEILANGYLCEPTWIWIWVYENIT